MSDIKNWLERHGLGKYTEVFVENEVDWVDQDRAADARSLLTPI